MGIIKRAMLKVQDKANSFTEAVAALDPKQKAQLKQLLSEAQSRLPDMTGQASQQQIQDWLGAAGVEIYQDYLAQLKSAYEPKQNDARFNADNRIRWFDITRWVTDPKEKNLDKLVNVYQVLSKEDCGIALIYHRRKDDCQVSIAVANTSGNDEPTIANDFKERLVSALRGNFPGAELKTAGPQNGVLPCLADAIREDKNGRHVYSVAVVSNLASDKSADFISQTMEKLLDGIVPAVQQEEYALVLLAKPVKDQLLYQNDLFQMYSDLAPYASWQVSHTLSKSNTAGGSGIAGGSLCIGAHAGVPIGPKANAGVSANFGVNFARSSTVSVQIGENEAVTETYTNYGVQYALKAIEEQLKKLEESAALGMWEFAAYALSDSPVIANNVAQMYLALTQGKGSFMTNASVNLWYGSDEADKAAAEKIIGSVQTLRHPVFARKSNGTEWTLYPEEVTPSVLLSGGELARSLNFPSRSVSGLPVLESVTFGREVKKLDTSSSQEKEYTPGLSIPLGKICHMRREEDTPVSLDVDSLASHVFITGTTGAGKSNTVYQMLDGLMKRGTSFLVIEPAKGEYKYVFGGKATVYGTNPDMGELLRIDPFSFPAQIHIYEHLDRLVEIFNVCWPMYAAMPAVLKDAVERAYVKAGWDLRRSVNRYNVRLFPSFADVLAQIDEVMEQSQYSSDNKSDYKGALSTRIRSLTNGINGMVFTADGLSEAELFDNNTIVDLSRVGSSETKSLIMGLLVMKLQEHRMAQGAMNSELKHVTVLEEAHNLLRRTSTEQSAEGSNLMGKSVEMLTNAIAEMRTYGEGFIIADQAPGLLDMAVIRNTNTKIIMRLPEYSDRELVGRAAGLNDDQIGEIAKLGRGVAAVYQNDWLEAVLCQVGRFTPEREQRDPAADRSVSRASVQDKNVIIHRLASGNIYGLLDGVDSAEAVLRSDMPAGAKCALIDYDRARGAREKLTAAAAFTYELLSAGIAFSTLPKRKMDAAEQRQFWVTYLATHLTPPPTPFSDAEMDNILCLITYWRAQCTNSPETRLLLAELVEREKEGIT